MTKPGGRSHFLRQLQQAEAFVLDFQDMARLKLFGGHEAAIFPFAEQTFVDPRAIAARQRDADLGTA